MTDDDHRRLLELQQQGPGGVVVETGAITIRGVGGAISAREITVDRVSGHGETAAATLEVLTDEAVLRRFTREGPAQEDPLGVVGRARSRNVTAVDIVVRGRDPAGGGPRARDATARDGRREARAAARVLRERVEDRIARARHRDRTRARSSTS